MSSFLECTEQDREDQDKISRHSGECSVMEGKKKECFKKEGLVKWHEDREVTFEFGKMKIMSNCCKNSFGEKVGSDISLFEVSQRDNGSKEVKKARSDNS